MQKEETDFHKERAEMSSSSHGEGSSDHLIGEPSENARKDWKVRLLQFKDRAFQKVIHSLPKNWKEQIVQKCNRDYIKKRIENFDPQAFSDWVSKAVQKKGASFYGALATIILSTYFLADLSALILGEYIPDPPISRSMRLGGGGFSSVKTIADYNSIFSRNLFNSQGIIPGEESAGTPGVDNSGPPQKTSLPLNLIGTLILSNERLSIATIEDRAAASAVFPVRIDDEIPGKLTVQSIEARRVIFINKMNGKREYLELPEDLMTQNPRLTPGKPAGGGIEKVATNQFNVSRNEVDKALADFNNILTQARAVPNFENGVAAGYKLFQIVPGSIYDKLGLQNGDVIVGLNGNPINDPAKAFEMLNELKVSNHLELQVKKDGKQSTYTYDIR